MSTKKKAADAPAASATPPVVAGVDLATRPDQTGVALDIEGEAGRKLYPSPFGFETLVAVVLAQEGGYVNHPSDPGGETKYGISKRAYPKLVIADLTEDQAREIYRRDYWDRLRCGELPGPIAAMVFDAAVNQGTGAAALMLQEVLRVKRDGIIGPATLAAANAVADPVHAAWEIGALRLERYTASPVFRTFKKGWRVRMLALAGFIGAAALGGCVTVEQARDRYCASLTEQGRQMVRDYAADGVQLVHCPGVAEVQP